MKNLILASASPRRKQLLKEAGFDFTVEVSEKEGEYDGSSPEKFAVRCAINKAEDIFLNKSEDKVVLAADTVVSLNGKIFEKPNSDAEARQMLLSLSGKTHEVITGYAILSKGMRETGRVITKVTFNTLDNQLIDAYIESKLWQGKAGAYGIQDGFNLVKECDGYYDNVVGLPIEYLSDTLKEFLK